MSKETAKKATFKDLIAKKLKKEEDQFRTKDIYVSSMDATLIFRKPKDELIIETAEYLTGDGLKNLVEGYKKLIYHCCDMLQDPELHKEIGVVDPYDTVEKIFDLADIMEIGDQLADFTNPTGVVDEIKN